MDKPTKPTNLMPRSFGGVKNNWSSSMQTSGYEDGVPAIYGGDNLNYQIDCTGKELDYCETICDFINNLPIGKTITVDSNNKLIYTDNINFSSRYIGEMIISSIPITDASVHLTDGALLQYGSYKAFIDYIADLYDSGNYSNIFETEANWQASVTTYGTCGKFVYDSVNNTVRLPKITGILEGTNTLAELGALVQAGLPVHTHNRGNMEISGYLIGETTASGGSFSTVPYTAASASSSDYESYYTDFYASRSWTGTTGNPIYSNNIQNTSTVQPQTTKVYYYIVVATGTKTDIEVDIDEIATDLNGKADTDLTNVDNTAHIMIAGQGMPSKTKYTALSLGASGTNYTAPANGYFCIAITTNSTGGLYIYRGNNVRYGQSVLYSSGQWVESFIPVNKGDKIAIQYNGTPSGSYFYFIYAVGSESEA